MGIVLGYLAAVFLVAALIAPWVWHGVHAAARASGHPAWESLTRHPFPRYLNRCLLVVALAGLLPVCRWLGIRTWRDAGLAGHGRALRHWVLGFAASATMFGAVLAVEWGTGLRAIRPGLELRAVPAAVGKAAASGAVVGVVEEVLFRGVLCGGLRPSLGWTGASLASSVVYAAVHFLERPARPQVVRWWTGLEAVRGMFAGLAGYGGLSPRFLTLVMAGMVLSQAYRSAGSLYAPMGLHGGWVFWIKVRGWSTVAGPGWGEGRLSGMASEWVWLGAVTLAYVAMRHAGARWAGSGARVSRE